MGTVYRAMHVRLRRPVAVKIIRRERAANPQVRQRFLREAMAVGRLDHPHIVRATDAAEHQGQPYLVMELLDGLDLQLVAKRCSPLPIPDACEVVRQAALGLQYAHERGLIHRDIKPSNLLLTIDGIVKILDLGLARLGPDPVTGEALSASELVLGTADYMAPEQALNPTEVDIRADLYSLGCTLYSFLAGHPPFHEHKTLFRKMKAHTDDPIPPIRECRSDVPTPLADLVHYLLARTPTSRPTTPAEAAVALEAFVVGADLKGLLSRARGQNPVESPPAPPPSPTTETAPTPPPTRVPRKARPLLTLLGLVAIVPILAVLISSKNLFHEPDEVLGPDTWHPLLRKQPVRLEFPRNVRLANVVHDPRKRELHVAAMNGLELHRLGTSSHSEYEVRFKIFQTAWGRSGIFFGYHTDDTQGEPTRVFQIIDIQYHPNVAKPWHVCRSLVRRTGKANDAITHLPRVSVDDPGLDPVELAIHVRRGQLVSVRWDVTELPFLTEAKVNALVTSRDYEGAFGLYVERATVDCSEAAFLYRSEGPP